MGIFGEEGSGFFERFLPLAAVAGSVKFVTDD
jgi:hypothetical protein